MAFMITPDGLRCRGAVKRSPLATGKETLKMEIVQPRANFRVVVIRGDHESSDCSAESTIERNNDCA
jgi:hypothetical protein